MPEAILLTLLFYFYAGARFTYQGRPRPRLTGPDQGRCPGFQGPDLCCQNRSRNQSQVSLFQEPLWDGWRKALRRRCRPVRWLPGPVPHPDFSCSQEPLWVCLRRPAPLLLFPLFPRRSPGWSPPSPLYFPGWFPQALLFLAEVSPPAHSGQASYRLMSCLLMNRLQKEPPCPPHKDLYLPIYAR